MGLLIQIWLFISPVIYPLSQVPESLRNIYCLNPMVSIIEIFRHSFLGESSINFSNRFRIINNSSSSNFRAY